MDSSSQFEATCCCVRLDAADAADADANANANGDVVFSCVASGLKLEQDCPSSDDSRLGLSDNSSGRSFGDSPNQLEWANTHA